MSKTLPLATALAALLAVTTPALAAPLPGPRPAETLPQDLDRTAVGPTVRCLLSQPCRKLVMEKLGELVRKLDKKDLSLKLMEALQKVSDAVQGVEQARRLDELERRLRLLDERLIRLEQLVIADTGKVPSDLQPAITSLRREIEGLRAGLAG